MKICLAGEGAQGMTHMQVISEMEDVEVVSLAGGIETDTAAFAKEWSIPHWSLDLEACLLQPGVEAVILTTPSQVHAEQTQLALNMGKHVLVEIPMGVSLEDAQRIADLEEQTGLVCMVCHTRRYMPAFRELQRRIREEEWHLHHIVTQTYFFRRENVNRFGTPRTWTDSLLWHLACHTVDTVYWLLGDPELTVWGQVGPEHSGLGIPMDMTIGMRSREGCLISAVYSFNHHGENWSSYRFIGEEASLCVEHGRIFDHEGNALPLAMQGPEDQDREFINAIREGRKLLTSCKACLPVMEILDRIEKCIDSQLAE
jgi:2-hydroxy-4-carboxymuconate semialdehyde hemiacetal dehydrogenase